MAPGLFAALLAAALAPAGHDLRIGDPAPDFVATALDGREISLGELVRTHKAVVIVFLSSVCPYARYFGDHLAELDRAYRPRGLLLVGVNSNPFESVDEMLEYAEAYGHTFPTIRDEGSRLADLLGAQRTPEAFVVDAEGRLRYRGWVKSKVLSPDLQRALDALLAGKPVRRAQTRAFGCAIDRARRKPALSAGPRPGTGRM